MRTPIDSRPCRSIPEALFDRAKSRTESPSYSLRDGGPNLRLKLERHELGRGGSVTSLCNGANAEEGRSATFASR
jgi:hypothetical protein